MSNPEVRETRNQPWDELEPELKVKKILERVACTSPETGILVFTTYKGLRSAFARTAKNQWELEPEYTLIGIYDRTFNPTSLNRILRLAAGLKNQYT